MCDNTNMNPNERPNKKPPSAVVIAVREKYDVLCQKVAGMEEAVQNAQRALAVATKNEQLLKTELSVLGSYLNLANDDAPTDDTPSKRSANLNITYRARQLLEQRSPRKTSELFVELEKQGVVFTVANPQQRISQLLSDSEWFENDRVKGWSLKSETPAGTGESGATESVEGQSTLGI